MFLPLQVDYDYVTRSPATWSLIAANVLLFGWMHLLPDEVLMQFLCWPDAFAPWQWVTSVFLHADIFHLGGNMLFLWVYGRYVEERLGPWRYLALYLALGVAAAWAFIIANLGSEIPALGASGAISGLMGVALIAAAGSRVKVLIVWLPIVRIVHVPIGFILALWVLEQFGLALIGSTGIAISAHLGGFAAGVAAALVLKSGRYAGSPWHLKPIEYTREGSRLEMEAMAMREAHRYRQSTGGDRPYGTHIPDWMRSPEQTDPHEEEKIRRWNRQ
jgi:membrane associated rhomboid family serine protease